MDHVPPGRPTDDPFFSVVRRRHPDVDLVLLEGDRPGVPPPGPASVPGAGSAEVADALGRVDAATAQWAGIAGGDAHPARLHRTARPDEVVARARVVLDEGDHTGALTRLAEALWAAGWDLRRFDQAIQRVEAHTPDLRLRASYADLTGVLVWQVESVPLVVGTELARSLVAAP